MFQEEHPHFVTGSFIPQNVFLGDQEYGRALDCLVKACTDLLLLDSDQPDCRLLLGKRIVEPQPDWWYVGGRMKPGERPEQSIARLVKRELHLDIDASRFQPLGCHSYAWARRSKLPWTMAPAISRWFSISDLIAGEGFHPALRASARDIWARQAWRTLKHKVQTGGSTESIAASAKKLVALSAMSIEVSK